MAQQPIPNTEVDDSTPVTLDTIYDNLGGNEEPGQTVDSGVSLTTRVRLYRLMDDRRARRSLTPPQLALLRLHHQLPSLMRALTSSAASISLPAHTYRLLSESVIELSRSYRPLGRPLKDCRSINRPSRLTD
jgi:hypothetical protein